jgi:hypothetical protein
VIELTKEQIDFIDDFASMPFDANYFFDIYGEAKVQAWISLPEIATAIKKRKQEIKRIRAKNEEIMFESVGMLKNKSLENIVKCLNDFSHPECIKVSMRLMEAELAYAKKRAEELGIKSGGMIDTKREPLKIIMDNDEETS